MVSVMGMKNLLSSFAEVIGVPLTPGEFHIRPPAGLTIGLNVGRVFQSAYDLLNFAQLVAAGHLTKEGFVDAAKRVLERNHLPVHNHL